MNIWIINQYAKPISKSYGGSRHYSIAKQLVKSGDTVTIITSDFDHKTKTKIIDLEKNQLTTEEAGVAFCWIKSKGYQKNLLARLYDMINFSIAVYKIGKNLKNKPDVIIGSSPHLFSALAAALLARKLAVPFVLEIRDLWPESLIKILNLSHYHPLVVIFRIIEKYLYKRARLIITLLPKVADYLTKFKVNPTKVVWIPNGMDLELLQNITINGAVTKEVFTIAYAGAHGKPNALDTIIEAANLLQQEGYADKIKFVLIGEGTEKPRLQKIVAQQKLNNVIFKDPIPKLKIYNELNKADAFCVNLLDTNLYDYGVSLNKFFDYMALAKPSIVGIAAANNPIAEANGGITVTPGNAMEFKQAALTLFNMPILERTLLGKNAREYLEKHFDYKLLADQLACTLKNI